jgi:hypothetical protein
MKSNHEGIDLNVLKKPRYFIPLLCIFMLLIGAIGLVIWRPGIARGEYDIQSIIKMILGQEQRINKLEQKDSMQGTKITPNATKTPSTDATPPPTTTSTGSNLTGSTKPLVITMPPVTQVPILTCDVTQKTTITQQHEAEMKRLEQQCSDSLTSLYNTDFGSSYAQNAAISNATQACQSWYYSENQKFSQQLAVINCSP